MSTCTARPLFPALRGDDGGPDGCQGGDPTSGGYDVAMAVTVDELVQRAGAVIEEVARSGHRTVVTDHGRPVVAIVPITDGAYETDAILDLFGGYGALADLVPPGRSGVDELLAERRAEAAREQST